MIKRMIEKLGAVQKDKLLHFVVCLLSAFFMAKMASLLTKEAIMIAMTAFGVTLFVGVMKEIADECSPDNKFESKDLVADCIGAAVGIIMGLI